MAKNRLWFTNHSKASYKRRLRILCIAVYPFRWNQRNMATGPGISIKSVEQTLQTDTAPNIYHYRTSNGQHATHVRFVQLRATVAATRKTHPIIIGLWIVLGIAFGWFACTAVKYYFQYRLVQRTEHVLDGIPKESSWGRSENTSTLVQQRNGPTERTEETQTGS